MSGGDVQSTLNELERKLRELQAELSASGARPAPEAGGRASSPPPPEGPPPMPPYRPPVRHEEAQPTPPPVNPLQDQLDELLRFRDQLAEAAKALVEDYSRLLEQITRVTAPPVPAVPTPTPTPAAGHATFPVPPPTAPSTESTLFSGEVVVEAGPFADFAALAAFESALRQVPHAEEVDVRSFEEHRAVVALRLGAEVPLVFELRRASDEAFDVEHAEPGRLALTIHDGDLPFPMRP